MLWNQWPNATGMGGRMFMESVAEWDRNMHVDMILLFLTKTNQKKNNLSTYSSTLYIKVEADKTVPIPTFLYEAHGECQRAACSSYRTTRLITFSKSSC